MKRKIEDMRHAPASIYQNEQKVSISAYDAQELKP